MSVSHPVLNCAGYLQQILKLDFYQVHSFPVQIFGLAVHNCTNDLVI